jgi:hypothetical protein
MGRSAFLDAAIRTDSLMPPPFVLRIGLGDVCVIHEINAIAIARRRWLDATLCSIRTFFHFCHIR